MDSNIQGALSLYTEQINKKRLLMVFRFFSVCIKADPAVLLTVKVPVDGEMKDIEKAADVVKQDDKTFMLVPHEDCDIQDLGSAIAEVHPELRQRVLSMKVSADSDETALVLELVVPDVDKIRHDLLLEAVDTYFKVFKTSVEAERALTMARVAKYLLNASDEDKDELDSALDEQTAACIDAANESVDKKKKEIEEAYEAYMAEHEDKLASLQEKAAAASDSAANSMKME